jgi:NAD(P)-dependent dehydrogenase (short-subunit alcohol dehydrogenase family)
MSADERTVLVTGASRGLGRDMALRLSREGFRVFAGVRKPEDGARFAADTSGRVVPVLLDVTDARSVSAAAARVGELLGDRGLDALVNNAGVATFAPLEQQPLTELEQVFRINVFGLVALTQALLPQLRRAKGRIVNISSANGKLSMPFMAAYSASKFAVEAISDALRGELQPWGIRVIVVEPGAMATDIRVKGVDAWAQAQGQLPDAERALYAGAVKTLHAAIYAMEAGAGAQGDVSAAVFEALSDVEPRTRYAVGPGMDQLDALVKLPDVERDRILGGMLGLKSE